MGTKPAKAFAFEETTVLDTKVLGDKSTKLRMTADGYMVCMPRIARTGIQEYLGVEMGRPDLEKVKVYRPEGEVFAQDAVRSLAGKPITIEHPDQPVTSANWRDFAVGHIGEDVMRDGEFIRVPLILMDAKAVEEVKSGRSQLSVGYSAVIEWADGVTPSGEKYQAKQTAIRANHVAITHTARGGPHLRMGDNDRRETMATRTITVDGLPVTLEDRDAQIVEKQLAKLTTDLATAQTALATAQTTAQNDVAVAKTEAATAKAEVQTKDAEIVTLKKQLDDAKIKPADLDKMVTDRVNTVQRAKAIIGDALIVDGKTVADMRKQVVLAKLGDVAKDWNDDMITASFNTLTVVPDASNNGNGLQHVVQVLQTSDTGGSNAVGKAYQQYDTDLTNRWKTAGARTAS
jgi:hypothetical protein